MKVKVINKSIYPLPKYAKEGDAGLDLRWNEPVGMEGSTVTLRPLGRHVFNTGLFTQLPEGYEFQVRSRSGLAAKFGVAVLNAPGTIDSGYTGEIKVILVNLSDADVVIRGGDRIAQLVLAKVGHVDWDDTVPELEATERGEGGFGHTGIN